MGPLDFSSMEATGDAGKGSPIGVGSREEEDRGDGEERQIFLRYFSIRRAAMTGEPSEGKRGFET